MLEIRWIVGILSFLNLCFRHLFPPVISIKKPELALFRPEKLKLDHRFKFKIDGKRPIFLPT